MEEIENENNVEINKPKKEFFFTELMKKNLFDIGKYMRITAFCTYALLGAFFLASLGFYIFKRPQYLYEQLPVDSFFGWIYLLVACLLILFFATRIHKTSNLISDAFWDKKNSYLDEASSVGVSLWKGFALAGAILLIVLFLIFVWVLKYFGII